MIKRWWFYWGVVGIIQVAFWFVPQQVASQYENWIKWGSGAILLIPFWFWIPYKLWKQAYPEIIKDQKDNPNKYITVYVCPEKMGLQLSSGKYVLMSVCFCNSLYYEVTMLNINGIARNNGEEANIVTRKSVVIKKGFTQEIFQIDKTNWIEMGLTGNPFGKVGIKMDLELYGDDDKNHPYKWSLKVGDVR
jgi:hypothetical protein